MGKLKLPINGRFHNFGQVNIVIFTNFGQVMLLLQIIGKTIDYQVLRSNSKKISLINLLPVKGKYLHKTAILVYALSIKVSQSNNF